MDGHTTTQEKTQTQHQTLIRARNGIKMVMHVFVYAHNNTKRNLHLCVSQKSPVDKNNCLQDTQARARLETATKDNASTKCATNQTESGQTCAKICLWKDKTTGVAEQNMCMKTWRHRSKTGHGNETRAHRGARSQESWRHLFRDPRAHNCQDMLLGTRAQPVSIAHLHKCRV